MLCPKCEAIRFPPEYFVNTSTRNTSSVKLAATNAKSKMKQLQPAATSLASFGAEADVTCINNCVKAISAITATAGDLVTPPVPVTSAVGAVELTGELKDDLSMLRCLVQQQQSEISRLQAQLKFVLSFLGIDEGDVSNDNEADHSERSQRQMMNLPHLPQDVPLASTVAVDDVISWTEVVRRKPIIKKPSNLQQSVIAAVYVDQSLKKRRETSIIVSGLESVPGKTDSELFAGLCSDELNVQPDVVKTKRLGNGNSSTNKPRPLLVVLREADQAHQLVSSARLLRRSTNQAIRERVYINPNLTKAEAEAAYLLRVKRRQSSQQRSDRSDASQLTHLTHLPPASDHSNDILLDVTTGQPKAAASFLNPQATQFTPCDATDVIPHLSE
jgi:hypothetical protein